ncbi:hypothetical protein BKA61DRAFT_663682 [Leptodontidium sp. MPI-SDFR-AT-0119]|nr:hypothetical protein BKA61DRAFT_663682 [Leptodontidium sp. MPI-SDFR-AT-0119]
MSEIFLSSVLLLVLGRNPQHRNRHLDSPPGVTALLEQMSTSVGTSSPPPGVVPNLEKQVDVSRTIYLVTNGLAIGLVTIFTLGRFYVRIWITKAVYIEDWFCIASWVLTILFCTGGFLSPLSEGRLHTSELSPADLMRGQKVEYATSLLYGPGVWCIKVTLLLILVRVFTPFRKVISAVWAFISVMLVYYIIVTALKVCICTPIRSRWDPQIPGRCLDEFILYFIDSCLSIVTDLIILLLPIPLVLSLRVSTRKRIRTIALLGAGGLATATTIIRLIMVIQLNNTSSKPGDRGLQIKLIYLRILVTYELVIGIICACLPAFNIFFTSGSAQRSRSRSRTRYANKSLKLNNLSAPRRSKGTTIAGSTVRESYIEISTPEDIGALIAPPEEAIESGSWPLRSSASANVRMESYFEPRDGV